MGDETDDLASERSGHGPGHDAQNRAAHRQSRGVPAPAVPSARCHQSDGQKPGAHGATTTVRSTPARPRAGSSRKMAMYLGENHGSGRIGRGLMPRIRSFGPTGTCGPVFLMAPSTRVYRAPNTEGSPHFSRTPRQRTLHFLKCPPPSSPSVDATATSRVVINASLTLCASRVAQMPRRDLLGRPLAKPETWFANVGDPADLLSVSCTPSSCAATLKPRCLVNLSCKARTGASLARVARFRRHHTRLRCRAQAPSLSKNHGTTKSASHSALHAVKKEGLAGANLLTLMVSGGP